jgi:hypothetical protein
VQAFRLARADVSAHGAHLAACNGEGMKDHTRILGSVFIGWAVAQALVAFIMVFFYAPGPVPSPFFWAATLLVVLAYGWVGVLLRQRHPRARVPAIALSAFALLNFPIGTAIGIYGLWTLLRQRELRAT